MDKTCVRRGICARVYVYVYVYMCVYVYVYVYICVFVYAQDYSYTDPLVLTHVLDTVMPSNNQLYVSRVT